MNESNTQYSDFIRTEINDIVVHKINFSRATMKEAQAFKDKVLFDILKKNLKIIIDLSSCEFIDSTFLGVLVVIMKKIEERNGEIKYIRPKESALYVFKITGLYEVLKIYSSIDNAIASFS